MSSSQRPHAVYRWFAYTGQLAYVGCSVDPDRRWAQHRTQNDWSHRVVSRRTVDWYDDETAARAAETDAIKTEAPLFNVHQTQRLSTHAPLLRWLTPEDSPVIPCLLRRTWLVGHDEIRRSLAQPPKVVGADRSVLGPYQAAVGLYFGVLDHVEAARVSRGY